jgi:hypothetical protein
VSATTVKLLHAAAEIAGGRYALAYRLGISEALLSRFMSDRRELPDTLLLRAVDIVLGDRLVLHAPELPGEPPSQDLLESPDQPLTTRQAHG